MAVYEYRCRTCETRFEARRPMAEAAAPIACPAGHEDTVRLLSVFATVNTDAHREPVVPAGGCGPGCACAAAG